MFYWEFDTISGRRWFRRVQMGSDKIEDREDREDREDIEIADKMSISIKGEYLQRTIETGHWKAWSQRSRHRAEEQKKCNLLNSPKISR